MNIANDRLECQEEEEGSGANFLGATIKGNLAPWLKSALSQQLRVSSETPGVEDPGAIPQLTRIPLHYKIVVRLQPGSTRLPPIFVAYGFSLRHSRHQR